jgi:predicted RNA binding protein YcfA (HicA-like mRNA interferase family)
MPAFEINTRKIVSRLKAEGWIETSGGKHDKFEHPDRPDVLLVVPRHKEQSLGVARSIARLAGWL